MIHTSINIAERIKPFQKPVSTFVSFNIYPRENHISAIGNMSSPNTEGMIHKYPKRIRKGNAQNMYTFFAVKNYAAILVQNKTSKNHIGEFQLTLPIKNIFFKASIAVVSCKHILIIIAIPFHTK